MLPWTEWLCDRGRRRDRGPAAAASVALDFVFAHTQVVFLMPTNTAFSNGMYPPEPKLMNMSAGIGPPPGGPFSRESLGRQLGYHSEQPQSLSFFVSPRVVSVVPDGLPGPNPK